MCVDMGGLLSARGPGVLPRWRGPDVGGAGAVGAYDAGFALRPVTVRWLGMFLADPLAGAEAGIVACGRHTGLPPRFAMIPAAAVPPGPGLQAVRQRARGHGS